jgi:hypothetical protein
MALEDLSEIYKSIQNARANALNIESLTLSARTLAGVPTVECEGPDRLYGFPLYVREWVPENMALMTSKCLCGPLERMRPHHLTKHIAILDFRTDEQRAADEA